MATDRLSRHYDGRSDEEIYERLLVELGPVADKYALKVGRSDATNTVSVKRTGLRGQLAVADGTVEAALELSFLLRPIRRPILSGVEEVLDRLF